MRILINCSGRLAGGGLQVADSVCNSLNEFPNHSFTVVLSKYMIATKSRMQKSQSTNVKIIDYTINKSSLGLLLFGRDKFLDSIVENENIDIVLSIFGPIIWIPRCIHFCGFARSHLVIPESPYFSRFTQIERIKENIHNRILKYLFERTTKFYFTENPYITEKLKKLIKGTQVITITNYYNQVFDIPENQKYRKLPTFGGNTILTVSNMYPHKNLEIAVPISRYLKRKYPDFKFRFIITVDQKQYPLLDDDVKDCFCFLGTVDISECPSIYEQCDIVFQPTLLECFTATYPEAMRMRKPIITTDIEFAKGLCADAALYYSPLSAEDAAECIYRVANNSDVISNLVRKGTERLKKFDTYAQRSRKMIAACEKLCKDGYLYK